MEAAVSRVLVVLGRGSRKDCKVIEMRFLYREVYEQQLIPDISDMLRRCTCLTTYPWFYSQNLFLANTAFFRINANIRLLLSMSKQISFPQWCRERCNYFPFLCVRKHYWDWEIPTFPPFAWESWRFAGVWFNGRAAAPPLLPLMRITCWDPETCLLRNAGSGRRWSEGPSRSVESEWFSRDGSFTFSEN